MILKATMSPTKDFAKVGVPPRSFIKENYGVKNYGHGFDAIKRKERHDKDEDAQVRHSLHVSQNIITSKSKKTMQFWIKFLSSINKIVELDL
jgi:hypothetical protein